MWASTSIAQIGIKQVYRQMDASLPKYLMRAVGCDVSFGTIFALNPCLVIVLVPLFTLLTTKRHPFFSILVGSFCIAIGSFVFMFGASFWIAVGFVIIVSVGESFAAPRMTEYSASIAPEGREGTYLALSHAPMFLGKILGGFSGVRPSYVCLCVFGRRYE